MRTTKTNKRSTVESKQGKDLRSQQIWVCFLISFMVQEQTVDIQPPEMPDQDIGSKHGEIGNCFPDITTVTPKKIQK